MFETQIFFVDFTRTRRRLHDSCAANDPFTMAINWVILHICQSSSKIAAEFTRLWWCRVLDWVLLFLLFEMQRYIHNYSITGRDVCKVTDCNLCKSWHFPPHLQPVLLQWRPLIEVLQMKQAVLKNQRIGQARRARPIGWVLSTASFICRTFYVYCEPAHTFQIQKSYCSW